MGKYTKPVFVNQLLDNRQVKIASKFIAYKTWNDPSLWFAEVIDDGNAFFHWHQGHRDSIINYITADGTKWQATIKNYEFFHSPEGNTSKGHSDTVIAYISGDNRAYEGRFAEWFDEGEESLQRKELLLVGGWKIADMQVALLPERAATVLGEAIATLIGVEYTPVLYCGEQNVNGTNYMIICKQRLMDKERTEHLVKVIINAGESGNTILSIETLV